METLNWIDLRRQKGRDRTGPGIVSPYKRVRCGMSARHGCGWGAMVVCAGRTRKMPRLDELIPIGDTVRESRGTFSSRSFLCDKVDLET